MNTKKINSILYITLITFLISGCGGGGGNGNNGITTGPTPGGAGPAPSTIQGANNLTLFSNPTDPTLFSFVTDNGEKLTLLGKKDISGNAQSVTHIELVDTDGKIYLVEYDDFGIVSRVIDEAGNFISLNFLGGVGANQSVVSVSHQDNGPINITSVGAQIGTADDGIVFNTGINLNTPIVVDPDEALAALNSLEPVGNLNIEILKCGQPAAPSSVVVNYKKPGAFSGSRYPVFKTSIPGQYVANIPQQNDDARDIANACKSVDSALGNICAVNATTDPTIQSGLCSQLALSAEVINPIPGDSIAVFPACLALFKAANLACGTLGFSPDPTPGATSFLGAICNNAESAMDSFDRAVGLDTAVIQAVADFNSGVPTISVPGTNSNISTSTEETVSVFGPFPNLTINSSAPELDNFFTAPSNPGPSEGYTATAEFSCVETYTMKLSVSGSDGFSSSLSKIAVSSQDKISLDVPGGAETVQDAITAEAVSPAALVDVKKNIVVVF